MTETSLKIIRPGQPQFDLSQELLNHLVRANRTYLGGKESLVDVLDGMDDLVTTAVSMFYEALEEVVDETYDEGAVLQNAHRALREAKLLLLKNLRQNLFPEESYPDLGAN